MSKILVSMWVYEEERNFIKVEAAKREMTMADLVREMKKTFAAKKV